MIIFTSPIVIEKLGKFSGRNILVMAGVHGNESFGVNIIKELIPSLKIERGKVTFIIANPEAVKQNKRFMEYNLNRCFLKKQPQNIFNSYEGKIARDIMPILEEADWLLDIHGSNSLNSIPFIICGEKSFGIAQSLPFGIISYNWDKFQPGSSDYYMNLQNKIGICVECGYINDSDSKEVAKSTIIDFLMLAGVINGKIPLSNSKKLLKITKQYKNKFGKFKKSRGFGDFEKLDKTELIGFDGNNKVFGNKGEMLLFVRDREKLGEECFLVAKETLLNSKKLSQFRLEVNMKLELRKLRISDAKELMNAINNKDVIPYLDQNRKYPVSLDYAKKSITKSIDDKKNYKKAIIANGKFIGTISLYNPNENKRIFEVGYFIARPYWNKGIATESVKRMTEFGFKKLKLTRIWAITSSNNPASGRVLEKAGYKLEGIMRKSIYKKGKCFDQLMYGVVK